MQDNLNLSINGGSADGVRNYDSLGKIMEDGFYKNSAYYSGPHLDLALSKNCGDFSVPAPCSVRPMLAIVVS